MQDALQIKRQRDEGEHLRAEGGNRGYDGQREDLVSQEVDGNKRSRPRARAQDQRHAGHRGQSERRAAEPLISVARNQIDADKAETEGRDVQKRAGKIEPSGGRAHRQRRAPDEKRENADGNVDGEQPFPRSQRQDSGSDRRTESGGGRHHKRVQTDAAAKLVRRISKAHERAIDAHDAACAQALGHAGENEDGKALCEGAGEGRRGEQGDAGEENAAIADHFAQRGQRQKRNYDRQLKSVHHPNGLITGGGELARDRRQSHIGDSAVENRHRQGEPDGAGRPITPRNRQTVKVGHRSSNRGSQSTETPAAVRLTWITRF